MKRTISWISAVVIGCLILVVGAGTVIAGAEQKYAGKVLILKRRPPTYFAKAGDFVRFLKKNNIKNVYENDKQTWAFETMSFFKRPLGDYEVEMVFYDVTDGKNPKKRRFVDSFTQYTQDRNTKSLSGKIGLIRPAFDAKRTYQVVATSHGKSLATGQFKTHGRSQAQIDEQKRFEAEQAKLQKAVKEMEQKAKEQEEAQKKRDAQAAEDLF